MDQLRRRHYDNPEDFRDAWALLVKNAKTFNKRGSPVYSDACALDPVFKSTFAKYFPATAKTPGRPKGSQIVVGEAKSTSAPVNLNNNNVLGAKVKNLLNSDDIYTYNERDMEDGKFLKKKNSGISLTKKNEKLKSKNKQMRISRKEINKNTSIILENGNQQKEMMKMKVILN